MSRQFKKDKLYQFIKQYRGSYIQDKEGNILRWTRSPDASKKVAILKLLNELGLTEKDYMTEIDNFKTYDQFEAWFKALK